jgi:dCTP diphosphatase
MTNPNPNNPPSNSARVIAEGRTLSFGAMELIAVKHRKRVVAKTPTIRQTLSSSEGSPESDCDIRTVRNEIFYLCSVAGELCQTMMSFHEQTPMLQQRTGMAKLFLSLLYTANVVCEMNLMECIVKKMTLNAKKYPAHLCKGKSGKYTSYSEQTGITKTEGQSTLEQAEEIDPNETVQSLTGRIDQFAKEREWDQYHTPRNIMLALMGEVGELAELFQWKGDETDASTVDPVFWDKVGQEMADVAIYLLRMAKVSGIDLGNEAATLTEAEDETNTAKLARPHRSPRSTIPPSCAAEE